MIDLILTFGLVQRFHTLGIYYIMSYLIYAQCYIALISTHNLIYNLGHRYTQYTCQYALQINSLSVIYDRSKYKTFG